MINCLLIKNTGVLKIYYTSFPEGWLTCLNFVNIFIIVK